MNVREALESIIGIFPEGIPVKFHLSITEERVCGELAPIIERALRAAAMEMNAVHGWADYDVTPIEVDGCVTAGVAAMVEES